MFVCVCVSVCMREYLFFHHKQAKVYQQNVTVLLRDFSNENLAKVQ